MRLYVQVIKVAVCSEHQQQLTVTLLQVKKKKTKIILGSVCLSHLLFV